MANPIQPDIPGQILIRGQSLRKTRLLFDPSPTAEILQKVLQTHDLTPLQQRIVAGLESDGLDVFIIGTKSSGKMSACLFPILSNILELHKDTPQQERIAAPSTIIFCPTTSRAMQLKSRIQSAFYSAIDEILAKWDLPSKNLAKIPNVLLADNLTTEEGRKALQQPLDILISTSIVLEQLFDSEIKLNKQLNLTFDRVRHIVFDDLAMKHELCGKDLSLFLRDINILQNSAVTDKYTHPNCQLVFCGTEWNTDTSEVDALLSRNSRKTVKIFGSPVHVLQCFNINWKVVHVENELQKVRELATICNEMLQEYRKTLISCSSSDLAESISSCLSNDEGITNILVTCENKGVFNGVFQRHLETNTNVIVVADDALEYLKVKDISCCIHFDTDVTVDKLSTDPFCTDRLKCLWDRLNSKGRPGCSNSTIISYVLLTGQETNLLAFHKFSLSNEIELPETLKKIMNEKSEEATMKQPLCRRMCSFGACFHPDCEFRHKITQEDTIISKDAPKEGNLSFHVIECKSPSFYIVKMLKNYTIAEDGMITDIKLYADDFKDRLLLLNEYYSNEQNCIRPLTVAIGEMFCIKARRQSGSWAYLRARVTRYFNDHGHLNVRNPGLIEMFCVDTGSTMEVPTEDLLLLPDKFKSWTAHCTQLVLSNLLTLVEFSDYCADAYQFAKNLTEGINWHGKVLLCLKDTIWVNPMVQFMEDPVTGHIVQGCNARTELTYQEKFARVDSSPHMMLMQEIIRKSVPDYPEFIHELSSLPGRKELHDLGSEADDTDDSEESNPIQWAALPLSEEEESNNSQVVEIYINSIINPWEMYGVDPQNRELVENLELEMTEEITQRYIPRHARIPHLITNCLKRKTVAAVKDSTSGKWQRAIILDKLQEEDDVSVKYNTVLVDHGTFEYNKREVEDVVPLLEKFVDALPFQMICLKLGHVQPLREMDIWNQGTYNATDFLSTVCQNRCVNVVPLSEIKETSLPCLHYDVLAFQEFEQPDGTLHCKEIGVQLVAHEAAKMALGTELRFQAICEAYEMHDLPADDWGILVNRELDFDSCATENNNSDSESDSWRKFLSDGCSTPEEGSSCAEGSGVSDASFNNDSLHEGDLLNVHTVESDEHETVAVEEETFYDALSESETE